MPYKKQPSLLNDGRGAGSFVGSLAHEASFFQNAAADLPGGIAPDSFTEDIIRRATSKGINGNIFRFAKRVDILCIGLAFVTIVIAYVLFSLYNSVFGTLVIRMVQNPDNPDIYYLGGQMYACVGIGFAVQAIGTYFQQRAAERQVVQIKKTVMAAILSADVSWTTRACGKLPALVDEACRNIKEGLGVQSSRFVQFVMMTVCAVGVGTYHHAPLAWIMFAILCSFFPATFYLTFKEARYMRETLRKNADAMAVPEEAFNAAKPVVAFSLQRYLVKKFGEKLDQAFASANRLASTMGLSSSTRSLTGAVNYLVSAWICGYFIWSSPNPVDAAPDLVSCYMIVVMPGFVLFSMGPAITALTRARASMKMISAILESSITAADPEGVTKELTGIIEYKSVTYFYEPTVCTLNKVSLTIQPGQSVAFVGPSGCGKSTLTSLLCRVIRLEGPFSTGRLLVDGVDVDDMNVECLRKQIAVVSQDPRLFTTTIMENIRIGNPDATDEDVIEAAKKAHAHDFISKLPDTYQTMCGPSLTVLSGGQKQRIAIARAFLRRPKILILDEATSALDNASEKAVLNSLKAIINELHCTTISVAHRLSTIRDCDCIYVLGDPDNSGSRIVEHGKHEELLEYKAAYYELVVADEMMGEEGKKHLKQAYNEAHGITPTKGLSKALSKSLSIGSSLREDQHLSPANAGQPGEPGQAGQAGQSLHTGADQSPASGAITPSGGLGEVFNVGQEGAPEAGQGGPRVAFQMPEPEEEEETDDDDDEQLLPPKPVKQASKEIQRVLSAEAIEMLGEGVVETAEKTSAIQRFLSVLATARHVNARVFWTAVIGVAGMGMIPVVSGYLFGNICNTLGSAHDTDFMKRDILRLTWWYIGLMIIGTIVGYFGFAYDGKMVANVHRYYKKSLFGHLIYKDLEFFDKTENNAGRLCKVLSIDVMQTAEWIGEPFLIYVQTAVGLIGGASVAMGSNWAMALISLGCWGIMVPILTVIQRTGNPEVNKEPSAEVLNETIDNILTVHLFTMEGRVEEMYNRRLEKELAKAYRGCISIGVLAFATTLAPYLIETTMMMVSGFMIGAGQVTPQHALAAVYTVGFIAWLFSSVTATATIWRAAKISSVELRMILRSNESQAINEEIKNAELPIKPLQIDEIEFIGVNFSYPTRPDATVYKSVSFKVTRGQVVAFVGPSGCGKSTGVQLIERFYDIANAGQGRILINGKDIREYKLAELRAGIAMVLQEPTLFAGTVEENIALGSLDEDPGLNRIHRAAKLANATEFISGLAGAYQFDVGPRGRFLSGGQKQRIAIARALVRNPSVLILDEATSALDNKSERVVQQSLDKLLFDKKQSEYYLGRNIPVEQPWAPNIVFVIAHRLSAVQRADLLIVLNNHDGKGSVVEQVGNHATLSKKEGLYKRLLDAAGHH